MRSILHTWADKVPAELATETTQNVELHRNYLSYYYYYYCYYYCCCCCCCCYCYCYCYYYYYY